MSKVAFYIELPGDEYGNTAMPTAVVEARLVHGVPDEWPGKNPDRPGMIAIAPPKFVDTWGRWYEDGYGGWAEVEGPARILTRDEYEALLESVLRAAGSRYRSGWPTPVTTGDRRTGPSAWWFEGGACATCGRPVPGGGHTDECTGLAPGSEYRIDSRDNGGQA